MTMLNNVMKYITQTLQECFPVFCLAVTSEVLEISGSLRESLQQHCFSMTVDVMRALISQAAGPGNCPDSK